MEKQIKIRIIENHSVWDRFVSGSPHGTVFSTSSWITAGASAQGGTPVILGVWDEDTLIAGAGFVELVRGPLKKATIPILTPHGGFIYTIDPATAQSDTESLQLLCAEKLISHLQRKYHHVFLVHAPGFSDIRPFNWQGWKSTVQYTYILDITDTEKLWASFKERARRKIRKASETLKPGGALTPEQVGALYEKVFRTRDRIPPVPRSMVTAMMRNLMNSGLVEINTAMDSDGAIVALQVLVIDKHTVYTWVYGTLPEKNHTEADSLLIWNAVKRYSKTHKTLDMMGANIPSVAFFKKGFGGVLTPYYVTEYYSSFLARTAFHTYSVIRRFTAR